MILFLLVLTLSLLTVALLSPIVMVLSQAQWSAFTEVWAQPSLVKSFAVTLTAGGIGALLSCVAGLVFARIFAVYKWRGQRLERLMLIFPYLLPNFILASAYVTSWNPNTGLLNFLLPFPFGLYGTWGMTVMFATVHAPLAFLLLEDKIRKLDGSLFEAAKLSGALSWQRFLRIELPLLQAVLISAFVLCFSLNIAAFAIPAWIGAPAKAYPFAYKIYQALQVGGTDGFSVAGIYSIFLFLLAVPPLLILARIQKNEKRLTAMRGKIGRVRTELPPPKGFWFFRLLVWSSQIVIWVAPLTILFFTTLVKPGCLQREGLSCFNDLSFKSYSYVLFQLNETQLAFKGSATASLLGAAFIMVISIFILILTMRAPRAQVFADWVLNTPAATPGAIIALGLIVIGSGQFGFNFYNTIWIVVAAYIIKHLNIAYQPLRTGLAGISASLIESARLSGATKFGVWSKILIPLLKPEIMGGFFLVSIPMLGELTMSVFLVSPNFYSIGTVLFDLQDYADQASASALAIILVLAIITLNEVTRRLSRGRLGY